MATLGPLAPTSDGTIGASIDNETDRTTPYYTHIDEDPDSAGSDAVTNDQSETDGEYFVGFTSTAADFGSMDQSLKILHSIEAFDDGSSNDALDLYASVVASDESTAYTDEVIIGDELDTTKATTESTWVVNATGLAASKAEWDSAFVRLRWDYQKTAAGDDNQIFCYAFELNGTYTLAGTVNQTFRIRSDDSQTLNADAGWAAAIGADASMDAHTRFRIRFEIEETAGGSFSSALKLQYRKNAGSWTDVDFYDETGPAANPAVWCVLSDQYADLDATTDVLSNSAETFTAGDGNEDPDTVTVSLTSQHTEHEFAIMIPTFYDGPTQNVATNTFDFRLVESDGTIFTGTYDNPRITLTVPAGYIGGTFVETPNRIGPFADGDGNLYFIIEPSETDNVMMMIKSTDGGDTWAEVDGANRPTLVDLESVDCQQVGTSLHIAHHSDTEVHYHEFLTSDDGTNPDTWAVTDTVVENSMDAALEMQTCAIVVRTDGDIIVFYSKHNTASGDDRLHYRINTGGGFGSTIDLEVEAGWDWTAVVAVRGESDLAHIFYKGNDGATGPVYHRSLSSADSLSGRETVESNTGQTVQRDHIISELIYWDDAGEENILGVHLENADDLGYSVAVKDDASPDARRQLSTTTIEFDPGGGSRQMAASLCQDDEVAYFVFSDQATNDLWINEMTNDGGWGTETEIEDGLPDVDWVKANVFTHSSGNGGATVVGYIYDVGSGGFNGYVWYGENEIAAAGVGVPAHMVHYKKQRQ